jgi:hypothetical protein
MKKHAHRVNLHTSMYHLFAARLHHLFAPKMYHRFAAKMRHLFAAKMYHHSWEVKLLS